MSTFYSSRKSNDTDKAAAFRRFQDDLDQLHRQQESLRLEAKRAAITRILELIAEHGLTPIELGLSDRNGHGAFHRAVTTA